jgi:hypothetical protein
MSASSLLRCGLSSSRDVLGDQVDPQLAREALGDSGQLHLTAPEVVDDVLKLLLGGDHQPEAAALLLDGVGQAHQVEHAVDAAGHVLAHLVNHEHDAPGAAASAGEEVDGPVGEPVGRDVRGPHRAGVGVGAGVGGRAQQVQGVRRLVLGQDDVAPGLPVAARPGDAGERLLEGAEVGVALQGVFQLGQGEVARVVEPLEQGAVQGQDDALALAGDVLGGGEVDEDGQGAGLGVDGLQQGALAVGARAVEEEFGGGPALDVGVVQEVTGVEGAGAVEEGGDVAGVPAQALQDAVGQRRGAGQDLVDGLVQLAQGFLTRGFRPGGAHGVEVAGPLDGLPEEGGQGQGDTVDALGLEPGAQVGQLAADLEFFLRRIDVDQVGGSLRRVGLAEMPGDRLADLAERVRQRRHGAPPRAWRSASRSGWRSRLRRSGAV